MSKNGSRGTSEATRELAVAFGRKLNQLRRARGMSMNVLAKASGYSEPMICKLENGMTLPSIHALICLAGALDETLAAMVEPLEASGGRGISRPERSLRA